MYVSGNPINLVDPSGQCVPGNCPWNKKPNAIYMAPVSVLRTYQTYQGQEPDCVLHSITASYNWLAGTHLDPEAIVSLANWLPLRMIPEYGPVAPEQAVEIIDIINGIAQKNNINTPQLTAQEKWMTPTDLKTSLADPDSVVILFMQLNDSIFEGHAVVLAAYDPTHVDKRGNPKPWGTLNWWDNTKPYPRDIYWWTDTDFQRNINNYYIWKGPFNNVVEVRR